MTTIDALSDGTVRDLMEFCSTSTLRMLDGVSVAWRERVRHCSPKFATPRLRSTTSGGVIGWLVRALHRDEVRVGDFRYERASTIMMIIDAPFCTTSDPFC